MRKVYVLRGFDTRNFKYFTPTPAVFFSEVRARQVCADSFDKDPSIIMMYDTNLLNEELVGGIPEADRKCGNCLFDDGPPCHSCLELSHWESKES